MKIFNDNPTEAKVAETTVAFIAELRNDMRNRIRSVFDTACYTKSFALALIEVAKLHGFDELAEEMKSDLDSELND